MFLAGPDSRSPRGYRVDGGLSLVRYQGEMAHKNAVSSQIAHTDRMDGVRHNGGIIFRLSGQSLTFIRFSATFAAAGVQPTSTTLSMTPTRPNRQLQARRLHPRQYPIGTSTLYWRRSMLSVSLPRPK